ncbi:hypothetical protein H9649_09990 [Sporosarcina sp. Sa2YVA2]|uniref:YcdB/YcdC repeated domain-containing protein n=1 Tax=Sporosarcina quadrami TaxID=2762234 RepID=A0ABR8UAR9_9BACL|nr:YcdB/YcdC domain-containing protein [Sporosarcina quadrami]MBD7984915.1 hypothetical protein [Sporosarcina quadrami]
MKPNLTTLNTLTDFLTERVVFVENKEEELFEGKSYEIIDVESNELIAACTLGEDDQLLNFYYVNEPEPGNVTLEEMPTIAEKFIEAFYPNSLETYRLQAVIDLDEICIVEYALHEEVYGLYLPGTGFSITISTDGRVLQFTFSVDQIDIRYPSHVISADEAKRKYAELIDLELVIQKIDTDIYVNGDDSYRLVYKVKEAAMEVPASGEQPDTVSESNVYERVQMDVVPEASLHELIGITDNHLKIGEHMKDGIRTEKWQHDSLEMAENVDLSEAYSERMITIQVDSKTEKIVAVSNVEGWKARQNPLADDLLKQRALDFLCKLFPQAQTHFMMEVEEQFEDWQDEIGEEEEEEACGYVLHDDEIDEVEEEDSKAFFFQYHVGNIPVEECVTVIQVGLYSGHIISASIEPINEELFVLINTKPTLSKQQALEQLLQKLQMELAMAREFDEEGKSHYLVTYLPSYPETVGHIHMIDAEHGKTYFVDVGNTIFY